MDHTTPNHVERWFIISPVKSTMRLSVGTGGDYTVSYHALREDKIVFRKPTTERPKSNGFAVNSDIEHTRSTLNLSMSELARCLGVSRQALYNWMAGGSIKPENLTKLYELRSAADVISAANISDLPLFIHRKLPGGRTLSEAVAMGESGEVAARALLRLANEEAAQREALSRLLGGRGSRDVLGHEMPALTDRS
ncbi:MULTISPECIES: helix-turn-helix transcriptional regulator [unclassified Bradyrhizobium]|uniref:helix-turn-helix domain-containing protein n=1 Tax=unclassified Bradyrhizobium TaxID=2631580 RepID=UPI0028E6D8CD|nr:MULTISPECIES: helix-turn-helix transcriptional regulator [unclassified Bradyrhizobium]